MTPEARARQTIDALLTAAGWHVCDVPSANLRAATGVVIREFPLNAGHGFADYLRIVEKSTWISKVLVFPHTLVPRVNARAARAQPAYLFS